MKFSEFDPIQAARDFPVPDEDKIIRHADRAEALGLPNHRAINDAKQAEAIRREEFTRWIEVQEVLLVERKVAFASISGVGHRRVPVEEQAAWAEAVGSELARRKLAQAMLRVQHVDMDRLDDERRRERNDLLTRLASRNKALGGRKKLW